ncbi:Hypothetical predicted protein [Olea europaea subsp. europaea]|uniref:Uncharacterized protein n=1 Tax=Olea europaea subsp. europaea TaxID=158383 RepID=A0A8S0SX70_OLEEU|nr:Hypothetical predicted protein [Olea europaea subsp. europaea]
MWFYCTTDCKEDPDFIDSDRDFESEQDDIEYYRNLIEGIEIGLDCRQDEVHPKQKECNDTEVDELELLSSDELLFQCSFDDDGDDGNEQAFCFIPTPTLSREPRSSGLKSIAATMVPIQPDSVRVLIDDVNFEDVVDDMVDLGDAESGSTRVSMPRKKKAHKSKCIRRNAFLKSLFLVFDASWGVTC